MIDQQAIKSKCNQYVDVGHQKFVSSFVAHLSGFLCFKNGSKIKVSRQKKQIGRKTCTGPPTEGLVLINSAAMPPQITVKPS